MDGLGFVKSNSSRKGPRRLGASALGVLNFRGGARSRGTGLDLLNAPQSDQSGENCMLGLEGTRNSFKPLLELACGHQLSSFVAIGD